VGGVALVFAGADRALAPARAPRGRAAEARPAGFERLAAGFERLAAGLAVGSAAAVSADVGAARLSLRR